MPEQSTALVPVYGIIYKATNTINGKIYIGQTIGRLQGRINAHLSEAYMTNRSYHFYKAIKKYGKENFEWEVINFGNTKESLDLLEDFYICAFKTLFRECGYNMKRGGSSGKHSKESCKKISEFRKGMVFSEEHKANLKKARNKVKIEPMLGKKHSKITRKKMEESQRNRINAVDYINPFKNKKHSVESKKKMSLSSKGIRSERVKKMLKEFPEWALEKKEFTRQDVSDYFDINLELVKKYLKSFLESSFIEVSGFTGITKKRHKYSMVIQT